MPRGASQRGDDQDWHIVNVRTPSRPRPGRVHAPATTTGRFATFAIVALLILGMAVVNFTNLATARASQRAREVALRKALGASRRQLIVQFIGESIIVSVVAMLIALALVELAMPAFSAFLEADIEVAYLGREGILLPVVLLVLVVGILGGPLPGLLPVALRARDRCSRPTSRRRRPRDPAGCAAFSSSRQFASRSGSSSAPR
jgi:putative ABC transport system permease protein